MLIGLPLLSLAAWLAFFRTSRTSQEAKSPPSVPVEALFAQAKDAIDRNETTEAAKLLDEILKQDPGHGMALLYRGHLAAERGDRKAALADWQRVPDAPARIGGTARHLEGTALLEMHRAREAERLLLRAVEMHPTYVEPRERLLKLYVAQLRAGEIRATLAGIRLLRPWTLAECALQVLAGRRFRSEEEWAGQMKAFADADRRDFESRRALCRYWLESQHYDDVVRTSRELLAPGRNDPAAAAILISALLEKNEQAAAEALLREYPLRSDSPASLWRVAGQHAFGAEDWRRAAECFQRVVRLDPYDVAGRYSLGTALARLGQSDEASRALEAATRLDQVERQALLVIRGLDREPKLLASTAVDIADRLVELQYYDDAAAWFQQALNRMPDDSRATAGYQRCLPHLRTDGQLANRKLPIKGSGLEISPLRPQRSPVGLGKNSAKGEPRPIRLRDVHTEAGIDFQYFNGQSGFKYILETVGGGVAVLDFDLDGWPDLYFPQGAPLPLEKNNGRYTDRLYRNQGDGTFADVTTAAQLRDTNFSQGAAIGDYDNDGFPDVVVLNFGRNSFYRNNGDGTFSEVTDEVGFRDSVASSCAAFADFDNDGLLDLYVVNYVIDPLRICRMSNGTIATCNPQNFAAEQDRLFRNRGDGTFEDVTESSGIVAPGGKGLGIVTADFDGDGKTDIYVANDGTPNFLFRNVSKGKGDVRFVERGLIAGTAMNGEGRSEAGMGIACADFDADGRLDLYVTNFYRETNTLYLNRGDMLFVDVTSRSGLAAPSREVLGFGTQAVDLNLDGLPDLIVANGDIDDYRSQGRPWKMRPQIFANLGAGRFLDVSADSGPYFQDNSLGRGLARLDWNCDGRPDLVVVHHDRPVALLTNETADTNHKIVLELHGVESNRDAVGAQIRITAGGRTQLHAICGGDGFSSSNERRQFIGLGQAKRIDTVEIRWPGGKLDRWSNVPVNSRIVCIEGIGRRSGRFLAEPILSENTK